MRTTLTIDDDLLRLARRRAAETGLSISEVINRALRRSMSSEPASPKTPPHTITFGTAGAAFPSDREIGRAESDLEDRHLMAKLGRG